MARLQEALRSLHTLRPLGDIGRSGGDLASVADLVDNFAGSQQLALCLDRFMALPGGRLGHGVAGVLHRLGYDPDFG